MAPINFPGPVLITGSNGGIGSHLVEYFLTKGARNILCHYRSSATNLEAILKKFDLDPVKHAFPADLSKEGEVEAMKAAVLAAWGKPWAVVNLAGASTNGMAWKLSHSDFQRVLADNLESAFLTTKAFLPEMRTQERGRIVNISSIVGHTGVAGAAHYCAAKAGIDGLTRATALEVAGKNITVNSISLGYFEYGLIEQVPKEFVENIKASIPLKRLGNAADLGALLTYLLSEDSSFLTGQVLHLNGGQRL